MESDFEDQLIEIVEMSYEAWAKKDNLDTLFPALQMYVRNRRPLKNDCFKELVNHWTRNHVFDPSVFYRLDCYEQ